MALVFAEKLTYKNHWYKIYQLRTIGWFKGENCGELLPLKCNVSQN